MKTYHQMKVANDLVAFIIRHYKQNNLVLKKDDIKNMLSQHDMFSQLPQDIQDMAIRDLRMWAKRFEQPKKKTGRFIRRIP